MNFIKIGLTLDLLGVVLLGITLLRVHWHVSKEHKIDNDVVRAMHLERWLGIVAIILIIIGYIFQILA